MTGWLWPLVLLVLVDIGRANDLDSLRSQLLRTHPELNAARRRIQAAELETGLAGRAEPLRLETELQPDPVGASGPGGGYRLELSRTLPLDGRQDRATALAQQDQLLRRVELCHLRGELLADLEFRLLDLQGAQRELDVLTHVAALQDSLLGLAERMTARGELSSLHLLELRREGQERQQERLEQQLRVTHQRRELERLLDSPPTETAAWLALEPATPEHPGPNPAAMEAALLRDEARLRHRLDTPRGLREVDLGLGLDGERDAGNWAHSLVFRVAVPLPRAEQEPQRLAALDHEAGSAEARLDAFERTRRLQSASLEDALAELETRRSQLKARREVSLRELHLREEVWSTGLGPQVDLLAARLTHTLLEREFVLLETETARRVLEHGLLEGTLPGTHDPIHCRCNTGSTTHEE